MPQLSITDDDVLASQHATSTADARDPGRRCRPQGVATCGLRREKPCDMAARMRPTEPASGSPAAAAGLGARQKGDEFEAAFREVMLSHMGFTHVQQKEFRRGAHTARGYECDLVATRGSGYFTALWILGGVVALFTGLRYFGEYVVTPNHRDFEIAVEDFVASYAPALVPYTWMALVLLAGTLLYLSSGRVRFDVLVECRDRKEIVTRAYVHEVSGRMQDMYEDKQAPTPNETWIVSSSEFDQDALTLATHRGIHCIRFRPGQRVELVNHALPTQAFRRSSWRTRSFIIDLATASQARGAVRR